MSATAQKTTSRTSNHTGLPPINTVRNIEHWPVERLIPYAHNARTHSANQLAQIAGSITEFGFVNPILVGEDNVIVAGHGRLLAAQQLGLKRVPVLVLDHLSEKQRRALTLADNLISDNAGFDEQLLQAELKALGDIDLDIDLENLQLDALIDDVLNMDFDTLLGEHKADDCTANDCDDMMPVLDNTHASISQAGDLWQLGKHRVLCGDATDRQAIDKLLAGDAADMVFTDPPYNVNYRGNLKQQSQQSVKPLLNDNLSHDYFAFIKTTLAHLLAVTQGACYIALATSEIDTVKRAFVEAGGHWSTFVIWAKNHFTLGNADYQRQFEAILYGWSKGRDHYWCGDRNQGDVWCIDKPHKNDLHPTMKPVALVERAINNSSRAGDIVLDTFAGSGTTLMACEKTKRQARLMELDPHYVDVIIKRWQDYTGKPAIRVSDGVAFDTLAAAQVTTEPDDLPEAA